MHRSDLIKKFIDKVNEEAEQEAQKVFDKYQSEFESLIKREKIKDEPLTQGMGTAIYNNINSWDLTTAEEKFLIEIAQAQYTEQRAGFECTEIK